MSRNAETEQARSLAAETEKTVELSKRFLAAVQNSPRVKSLRPRASAVDVSTPTKEKVGT